MAGALRLEGFCDGLERALERGHSPAAVAVKSILVANIRLVARAAAAQGYFPAHRRSVGTARKASPEV